MAVRIHRSTTLTVVWMAALAMVIAASLTSAAVLVTQRFDDRSELTATIADLERAGVAELAVVAQMTAISFEIAATEIPAVDSSSESQFAGEFAMRTLRDRRVDDVRELGERTDDAELVELADQLDRVDGRSGGQPAASLADRYDLAQELTDDLVATTTEGREVAELTSWTLLPLHGLVLDVAAARVESGSRNDAVVELSIGAGDSIYGWLPTALDEVIDLDLSSPLFGSAPARLDPVLLDRDVLRDTIAWINDVPASGVRPDPPHTLDDVIREVAVLHADLDAAVDAQVDEAVVVLTERRDDVGLDVLTILVIAFVPTLGAAALLVLALLRRLRVHRELRTAAEWDSLTGLVTRWTFERRTTELASTDDASVLALFHIDVDEFKSVNDGHGHEAGDAVLRSIGDRLNATSDRWAQHFADRSPDVIAARLGGDELCVLLRVDHLDEDETSRLGNELCDVLAGPVDLTQARIDVTTSVGVATGTTPLDGAELLRRADDALYVAKREGRGRARVAGALRARDRTAEEKQAESERLDRMHEIRPLGGPGSRRDRSASTIVVDPFDLADLPIREREQILAEMRAVAERRGHRFVEIEHHADVASSVARTHRHTDAPPATRSPDSPVGGGGPGATADQATPRRTNVATAAPLPPPSGSQGIAPGGHDLVPGTSPLESHELRRDRRDPSEP